MNEKKWICVIMQSSSSFIPSLTRFCRDFFLCVRHVQRHRGYFWNLFLSPLSLSWNHEVQDWVITTLCNLHICHFSFDLCFYRDTRLRQPPSLPLSLFPPLLAFLHLPPRLPWWALDYCCLSGFGLAAETWTGRHPAMRSFKNHQKHTPKPSFSNSTWKHSRGKSIFMAAAVGYNETTLWQ